MRGLLDGGLRLRTACDLTPVNAEVVDRSKQVLPSFEDLTAEVRAGIDACAHLFVGPVPLEVAWDGGRKKKVKSAAAGSRSDAGSETGDGG